MSHRPHGVVDRAARHQLADVHPLEVHVGEGKARAVEGRRQELGVDPGSFESRGEQRLDRPAEAESAIVGPADPSHRHHAGGVDRPQRRRDLRRQPLAPAGKRRGRKVLGDDQRRVRGEPGEGGGSRRFFRQPEGVGQPTGGELGAHVAGALEDEGVVAVAVEAVTAAESLVDEQRQVEGQRGEDGGVERRVFVAAHRVMHPVDDLAAGRQVAF